MGHNFGSWHDGIPGRSEDCPAGNNKIMTAILGFNNSLNLLKFSTCSIRQFKGTLLNAALKYILYF